MRRLIIVYNPRSSHAQKVRTEVIDPATQLDGFMIGKYQVRATDVDDNAARLAKLLQNGDLVVSAGGDGTATIAVNGCLLSKKDVSLAVLGYGNFNDTARAFKLKSLEDVMDGKTIKVHPLEALVDDKHFRYAISYFTIGLFAESTTIFDEKSTRTKLKTGRRGLFFSISHLASWYFKNKRHDFLPTFRFNGRRVVKKTTDYLAINSPTVARLMKGGDFYTAPKTFWSGTACLGSFFRLVVFMTRSFFARIPGSASSGDQLEFPTPATIRIQAEGEYYILKDISWLKIQKSERSLKIITRA